MSLAGLVALALLVCAPSGPQAVSVQVDAAASTFDLGGGTDALFAPRLLAVPLERQVRLIPSAEGPRPPLRWYLRLEVQGPEGTEPRALRKYTQTGKGRPPLYIDLQLPALKVGAYVATLEFRQGPSGDRAVSAPVVLPRPGRRTSPGRRVWVGRVRASAVTEDLAALAKELPSHLMRPGYTLLLQGHWEPGRQANARSLQLAEQVRERLLELKLPSDRLQVQARADQDLRFPTFTAALKRRNRRVEIWRQPPPPQPAPTVPPVDLKPRSLVVSVDGKEAFIEVGKGSSQLDFSMDYDPPARVQLTWNDGWGGWSRVRRGMSQGGRTKRWVPSAWASVVHNGLQIAGGQVALGEEGPELELELRAPDEAKSWLVTVTSADGRMLWGHAAGVGPPPPRVRLSSTASVSMTRPPQVVLHVGLAKHRRARTPALAVPALTVTAPQAHAGEGEDIAAAFGALIKTLSTRSMTRLLVRVHGGSRKARARARRQIERRFGAEGLDLTRLEWSAGRAEGGLVLQAHVVETVSLVR